jgi:hypothetical protein
MIFYINFFQKKLKQIGSCKRRDSGWREEGSFNCANIFLQVIIRIVWSFNEVGIGYRANNWILSSRFTYCTVIRPFIRPFLVSVCLPVVICVCRCALFARKKNSHEDATRCELPSKSNCLNWRKSVHSM